MCAYIKKVNLTYKFYINSTISNFWPIFTYQPRALVLCFKGHWNRDSLTLPKGMSSLRNIKM